MNENNLDGQVIKYKIKNNNTYKTIYAFNSMFLTIQNKKYKIIGTHENNDNLKHDLKNIKTGEIRTVKHETILKWLGIINEQ